MKIVRSVEAAGIADAGSTVAIGTFDGVHLGHQALLAGTREAAAARRVASGVVTWDRHPSETIRPDETPPLLTSLDRKLELVATTGVDFTLVLPFDDDFSTWPPERFVEEVLVAGLGVRLVRVGHDWRFGHKAAGDTELLAKLGAEHGFEVDGVPLEEAGGAPVTSTRIRVAVTNGEVESAHTLLRRPFDLDGVVVRGDGRGASLGYPTANLAVDPALARPAQGVYAGRARVEGVSYRAAINVGKNPTFGGETMRVEAYILDFERALYGETIRVEFWHRLRDELKFDSVDALVAQMDDDVRRTRAL